MFHCYTTLCQKSERSNARFSRKTCYERTDERTDGGELIGPISASGRGPKIGQKFAREVLKRAFRKCGSRPPIMLLAEIDENAIFKLIFIRVFLHIIVEIGEKYALKHFFNQFEAKLTVEI